LKGLALLGSSIHHPQSAAVDVSSVATSIELDYLLNLQEPFLDNNKVGEIHRASRRIHNHSTLLNGRKYEKPDQ
jgi:hypothetical protein